MTHLAGKTRWSNLSYERNEQLAFQSHWHLFWLIPKYTTHAEEGGRDHVIATTNWHSKSPRSRSTDTR